MTVDIVIFIEQNEKDVYCVEKINLDVFVILVQIVYENFALRLCKDNNF